MAFDDDEGEDEGWIRIYEPVEGEITSRQEEAIRDYARGEGYETLRGFHWYLRREGWDYYDILRIVSP